MDIKNILKKNKFIYNLNATIKSNTIKREYQKNIDYYNRIEKKHTLEGLLIKAGFTEQWEEKIKGRKPRIYYVGTDEYQDKSGFLQDLSKISDVTYFCRKDGSYGHYREFYDDEITYRKLNVDIMIKDIEKLKNENKKPDIILMQGLGRAFDIDRLLEFKYKNNIKIINIAMDDRLVYKMKTSKKEKYNRGSFGMIKVSDLILTTSKECVEWYLKEEVAAIYFPLASSLDVYYPMNIAKKFDVGFIGNKYGIREEIINELIAAGIKVRAYGNGWKDGRISFKKNNEFFNECKIILGIGTVGYCKDFYTIKLRDFDAILSGSLYITHNNKDLHDLFKVNEEIILYDNIDDLIKKIKFLLQNENRIEEISKNGFKRCKNEHTYEKRFNDLLKILKIF